MGLAVIRQFATNSVPAAILGCKGIPETTSPTGVIKSGERFGKPCESGGESPLSPGGWTAGGLMILSEGTTVEKRIPGEARAGSWTRIRLQRISLERIQRKWTVRPTV